jgi:diaminohydroxyphosphoribosylaminopyrimidine deaminase/5-amino-6-(5-phosphoribosylamino)uracil reductase
MPGTGRGSAEVDGIVLPDDDRFMRRALWHAARGLGRTTPNPVVGAVIVDDEGVVVGLGHHVRAGGPHAEIVALADAGPRARGATLYCTLEPCSHTNRTGPCCVAVHEAGVRRVVVAIGDPNPRVNGAGVAYLRERGVEVTVGIRRLEAARQNAPFFSVMQRGRPYVIAKAATSLDGAVAARRGARTAITGREAFVWTQRLRGTIDAVAVGAGTVLADDPVLTARELWRARPLTRVVFDRRLRTPLWSRLLATLDQGPVAVVTTHDSAASSAARALERAGATIVATDGTVTDALRRLTTLDIQCLLVEGGPTLHAACWQEGVVDRVAELVADVALGPDAVPSGLPVLAGHVSRTRVSPLGRDVLMESDVHRVD